MHRRIYGVDIYTDEDDRVLYAVKDNGKAKIYRFNRSFNRYTDCTGCSLDTLRNSIRRSEIKFVRDNTDNATSESTPMSISEMIDRLNSRQK